MNKKLNILLENGVITEDAFNITNKTFDFISDQYEKESLEGSEMFWTHMCMALTRIERGETLEKPSEMIMQEINQTPFKTDIDKIITFVNAHLATGLPEEEVDFFYLHLHGLVEKNK